MEFAASVAELQTARDNAFRAATQMLMFVALDKAIERRVIAEKAIANVDATVAGLNDANLSARWQTAPTRAERPISCNCMRGKTKLRHFPMS